MQENKSVEIFLQVENQVEKKMLIYVRIHRLPLNISTLLNACANARTGWHLDPCYLSAC